jgi:small subunit ribosomal protein S8
MTMSDPLADLLTRIRNAQRAGHAEVELPSSRLKREVARVLKEEGYLDEVNEHNDGPIPLLKIRLRYHEGRPAIRLLRRVSRPGLRVYRDRRRLPRVQNGYGVAVISTSRGVMSDRQARVIGEGGEILCLVS